MKRSKLLADLFCDKKGSGGIGLENAWILKGNREDHWRSAGCGREGVRERMSE